MSKDWLYKRRLEQHQERLGRIKRGEYLLLLAVIILILYCMAAGYLGHSIVSSIH